MIGAEEFHARPSRSTGRATGDISDMEYIETFLIGDNRNLGGMSTLIDIVRPRLRPRQSMSSPRRGRSAVNSRGSRRKL